MYLFYVYFINLSAFLGAEFRADISPEVVKLKHSLLKVLLIRIICMCQRLYVQKSKARRAHDSRSSETMLAKPATISTFTKRMSGEKSRIMQ
jgi:hypothetical protein